MFLSSIKNKYIIIHSARNVNRTTMCKLAWDLFYFSPLFLDCYNVQTETADSSEIMFIFYQSTRHNNQKIHSSCSYSVSQYFFFLIIHIGRYANRFLKLPVLFVVEATIIFIRTILQFWKKTTVYSSLKEIRGFYSLQADPSFELMVDHSPSRSSMKTLVQPL
jgi:hypothetical protein